MSIQEVIEQLQTNSFCAISGLLKANPCEANSIMNLFEKSLEELKDCLRSVGAFGETFANLGFTPDDLNTVHTERPWSEVRQSSSLVQADPGLNEIQPLYLHMEEENLFEGNSADILADDSFGQWLLASNNENTNYTPNHLSIAALPCAGFVTYSTDTAFSTILPAEDMASVLSDLGGDILIDGRSNWSTSNIMATQKRKSQHQEEITMETRISHLRTNGWYKNEKIRNRIERAADKIPQPTELLAQCVTKLPDLDLERAAFLVTSFYAIGSTESFQQLRSIFANINEPWIVLYPGADDTILDTYQAIERLESGTTTASLVRRLHLVSLYDQYLKLQYSMTTQGIDHAPEVSLTCTRKPRKDTCAIGKIVSQIPEKAGTLNSSNKDEVFAKRRKAVRNKLQCAKKWHMLHKKFGLGILALVPLAGEYSITSQDLEYMRLPAFNLLLLQLEKHRGNFLCRIGALITESLQSCLKYRKVNQLALVKTSDEELLQKSMDCETFLYLCQPMVNMMDE